MNTMKTLATALAAMLALCATLSHAQCPSWCVNTGNATITHVPTCFGDSYQITITGEYTSNSTGNGNYTFNAQPGTSVSIGFYSSCYSCSPTNYCCAYDGQGNCIDNGCYHCNNCTYWNNDHTVNINVPEFPCSLSASATGIAPSAKGCNDGSIAYSASTNACNGYTVQIGSYTYGAEGLIQGLSAGDHVLTFSSVPGGCYETVTVTVPEGPCILSAALATSPASSPSCSDGAVTVLPQGTCQYTYCQLLANGNVVQGTSGWPVDTLPFTGLVPGPYEVRLYSAACEVAYPVTIGPACEIDAVVTTQGSAAAFCNNGVISVTADVGGCGAFQTTVTGVENGTPWQYGYSGQLPSGDTAIFNGLPPGTYSVLTERVPQVAGACQQTDVVVITSPGCVFPFAVSTEQATAATSCGDGEIVLQDYQGCEWTVTVMRPDSTIVWGPTSTFWYWGNDIVVGGLQTGTYLVRTYSAITVSGGGIEECETWATVQVGCESNALAVRMLLEGPYVSGSALMNDALRVLPIFPQTEPYTALGYLHTGGGGETITPSVLAVPGSDAIVDWVLVELRSPSSPSTVTQSRSALLQRDGDVVGTDGLSPLAFTVPPGTYHVAVRHRNHLAAMTLNPISLGPATATVDFTSASTATWGTNARKTVGGVQVLWAGDVTFNHAVKYTGSGNDRDPILVKVGSTTPNNTVNGYWREDVNMNGVVKYTGSGNDRDPILVNVGSTTPNNVRAEQLP